MLCGRGTGRFAFDTDHQIEPPYPFNEVDLVALTGTKAEGYRFSTILSNTIGKLGHYSEFLQRVIRALPDGIFSIEAFPGAGKTTVAAALDAFLCLLSENFKILVIAGQHTALDALNHNLNDRLKFSVPIINKILSADSSERTVQYPLVLRDHGDHQSEMMEFVRIVRTGSDPGPDRIRPNTLCQLLLQLLDVGDHSLPAFSKSGLTELADSIKSQDSAGFQKLRQFVAGELTWDDANHMPETLDLERPEQQQDGPCKDIVISKTSESPGLNNKLQSQRTAKNALIEITHHILPLVNILICSTAAATKKIYKEFVDAADLCQNEEAGATSCFQIFAGWRGIGQALIISGDSAQFGPHVRSHVSHIFQDYLAISTLDIIKNGGYPVFHLSTQHRAIDGQFDPVYQNFYGRFRSIESPASQHPDNHPDAQRVEAAFVANFSGLQRSPAGRIIPMFIHVSPSSCEQGKTSRHRPNFKMSRHSAEQVVAAEFVVKKLTSCAIKPEDIMVIAAYRAEFVELRKTIQDDVFVTTADSAQGQERSYVVFVFSVNRNTGPGFTMDPRRLCVAMTRQKKFLAMVGDIETPSGGEDVKDLASIHNYFIRHKRVGHYSKTQQAVQDATEAPIVFTTDVRDEQREKLVAQIEAAHAALRDYDASKSTRLAASPSTSSAPSQQPTEVSQQDKSITKPMTLTQMMADFITPSAAKAVPKAGADTGDSWASSADADNSWGGPVDTDGSWGGAADSDSS